MFFPISIRLMDLYVQFKGTFYKTNVTTILELDLDQSSKSFELSELIH